MSIPNRLPEGNNFSYSSSSTGKHTAIFRNSGHAATFRAELGTIGKSPRIKEVGDGLFRMDWTMPLKANDPGTQFLRELVPKTFNRINGSDNSFKYNSGEAGRGSVTGEFLWKPVSEGDGKLAVLIPPGAAPSTLSIRDRNGNIIESVSATSTFDDGRKIYRFSKPGSAYPAGVSVNGIAIGNPGARFESGMDQLGSFNSTGGFDIGDPVATLLELGSENVLGRVPDVADFDKTTADEAIKESIESALSNFDDASLLTGKVNADITEKALERLERLVPGGTGIFSDIAGQIGRLVKGQLPNDTINDVASDRAELSSILGFQGGDIASTLKDLGLTQLDAIDRGASMFERIIAAAEAVDPTGRQSTVNQYQLSPLEVLGSNIDQNKILQDTQQAKNNAAAAPDPEARALFQILTQTNALQGIPSAIGYNPLESGPFEAQGINNELLGNI